MITMIWMSHELKLWKRRKDASHCFQIEHHNQKHGMALRVQRLNKIERVSFSSY